MTVVMCLFVTAWSVCRFWHHRPRHPNQKVTYHFWMLWIGPGLVHLLSKLSHSVLFCWSWINSIRFEMWCTTRLNSGTSFIYFVHTVSRHCHLLVRPLFADDSQLHNSSIHSDFPALVHILKDCIEDAAKWMSDSMLKMNNDKTELIAIGTKSKIS